MGCHSVQKSGRSLKWQGRLNGAPIYFSFRSWDQFLRKSPLSLKSELFSIKLSSFYSALKVASISWGCSTYSNYERIEASAIKVRQAGGFFGAAPEAIVQLTIILLSRKEQEFSEFSLDRNNQ